jgi:hypothetical protein
MIPIILIRFCETLWAALLRFGIICPEVVDVIRGPMPPMNLEEWPLCSSISGTLDSPFWEKNTARRPEE